MSPTPSRPASVWSLVFYSHTGQKRWGSLVLAFTLVMLAAGLVWGANAFSAASQWVVHTNQARMDVENILVSINEAESAHRGYLLSGSSQFRQQSLVAQQRALTLSEGLARLVSDNLPQQKRAEILRGVMVKRFEIIETVAKIYQQQGFKKAHEKWLALRLQSGLPQQTRALATKMVEEEYALLLQRQAHTRVLALAVELLALAGMTLALLMVGLMGLSYRREASIRDHAAALTQATNSKLEASLCAVERDHAAAKALAEFASLLQGCQTTEEIFQVSAHSITRILPGTEGSFYLMRASRDHAQVQADWGQVQANRPESITPAQCWALRQGRPFAATPGQLLCAHRVSLAGHSTCIPMMVQGTEVGLLFIQHAPDWHGQSLAEASSEQLALAITNLRLRETLRTQSLRDPLTGLSNRRELDELFPRELARALRQQQPLSVMVLDIDHFKRFNDTFGHDAGDAVLREFAHLLKKSMRIEDLVARLGGEEFVVVLPGLSAIQARELAERLRQQVQVLNVAHQGVSLGQITTSIGISQCPPYPINEQDLITRADAALYLAKNSGRNRTEVAQDHAAP